MQRLLVGALTLLLFGGFTAGQMPSTCFSNNPCDLGEGICDSDSGCLGSLTCGSGNCPWSSIYDGCCTGSQVSPSPGDWSTLTPPVYCAHTHCKSNLTVTDCFASFTLGGPRVLDVWTRVSGLRQ